MSQRRAANAFYLAVVLSAILPFVPILRFLLLPFDYLNTHLHEMGHAIVAILTGGHVERIEVYASAAGVTLSRGGIPAAILMSGYLGASLFGSAMVQSSNTEKASRIWLRVLGILVLISNIIWVRGDIVGWTIGLAWPVVILFLAARLKGDQVLFAAQFFGVQQCLNAIKSLRDLILLSGSTTSTDAQLLANDTHIPAIVWALIWTGVSLFGIISAMVKIGRQPSSPRS